MAGKTSASSYDDDEAGTMSDINVTPLVDVTLVLLIVFMITVPAIVGSAQLKVDLPESIAADPTVAELPLRLAVRLEPTGEIGLYLNDQRTDEASLKRLVADIRQGGSDPPALLAADKKIAYGEVVKVIDLLTALGLHKVSLETRRVAGN
jgi:biopolymer transport protein TolR